MKLTKPAIALGALLAVGGLFTCNPHGCAPKKAKAKVGSSSYAPVPLRELKEVRLKKYDCDTQAIFTGEQGIYNYDVEVGTATGDITFLCNSQSIPDRFQVRCGGELVVDTGFIGNPHFNDDLRKAGYGPVKNSGYMKFTLNKTLKKPTTVEIKIIAPFPGTAWECYVSCPGSSIDDSLLERY